MNAEMVDEMHSKECLAQIPFVQQEGQETVTNLKDVSCEVYFGK